MCCIGNCDCCKHCCGVEQDNPCPKGCKCANSSTHREMEIKLFGFSNQKSVSAIIKDMLDECGNKDDPKIKVAINTLNEVQKRIGSKI